MGPSAVDLLEPGMVAYVKGAPDEAIFDDNAKGGVVWLVETDVDRETGEVSRAVWTVRQSRGRLRFGRLRANEVGETQLANAATIRPLVRALARELGTGCSCKLRRSTIVSDDARLLDAALALFRTLV